jgi:hypothetical protein
MTKVERIALKIQRKTLAHFTYVSDNEKYGKAETFDREHEKLKNGVHFMGDCDCFAGTATSFARDTHLYPESKMHEMVTCDHYIAGLYDPEIEDVWVIECNGYEYTPKALSHNVDFMMIQEMPEWQKIEQGYIEAKVYRLSELQRGIILPSVQGDGMFLPEMVKKYELEQFRTCDEPLGQKWWDRDNAVPYMRGFDSNRCQEAMREKREYKYTKEWKAHISASIGILEIDISYDSDRTAGNRFQADATVAGIGLGAIKAGKSASKKVAVKEIKEREYGINRAWQGIVVHMSDSSWGTEKDIYDWHVHGNGWQDTGYHFVITNKNYNNHLQLPFMNGAISAGRNLSKNGAHTLYGYNKTHIGICCIHNSQPNRAQASTLFKACKNLMEIYDFNADAVLGHDEIQDKVCPGFDVSDLRDALWADDESMFVNMFEG